MIDASSPGRRTFPPSEHLRYGHEFRRVYQGGHRVVGSVAIFYVRNVPPGEAGATGRPRRVGIVTSRRLGNAVARNRARRLLREAYRLNKHKLKNQVELVVIARAAINGKRFPDVEPRLMELFQAAGILTEA